MRKIKIAQSPFSEFNEQKEIQNDESKLADTPKLKESSSEKFVWEDPDDEPEDKEPSGGKYIWDDSDPEEDETQDETNKEKTPSIKEMQKTEKDINAIIDAARKEIKTMKENMETEGISLFSGKMLADKTKNQNNSKKDGKDEI